MNKKITNLEWLLENYKKHELDLAFPVCELCFFIKNKKECDNCDEHCEFYDDEKAFEYLLQEHKKPIKLKQWEYDLLTLIDKEREFCSIYKLRKLREKGHFKGVTNTLMDMEEILEDYVIVSDDYEGFEDCK